MTRRTIKGVDVADPKARRCLACGFRCQGDESVCKCCGVYVSRIWPPPGGVVVTVPDGRGSYERVDVSTRHNRENCRHLGPLGHGRDLALGGNGLPCWVPPTRFKVLKGGGS